MLSLTLQGLAEAGHEIMLVAPSDDIESHGSMSTPMPSIIDKVQLISTARRSWIAAASNALRRGRSLSVARHHLPAVESAVADCIARWQPDVVHAEQLQALANCTPALQAGIPIVLRMQNVESAIWRQSALTNLATLPLLMEARRLRRDERSALVTATRTVTLSDRDASQLRELSTADDRDRVVAIAPPFPNVLPAGAATAGEPAFVIAGSSGWRPNRRGTRWFLDDVWPHLHAAIPRSQLHVFGGDTPTNNDTVSQYQSPDDSIVAFPAGAVALVPLQVGSGIRMRILEAWARGLPVIATSTAATGLDVISGRELLIADTRDEFVDAGMLLASQSRVRESLIAAGRAYLAQRHDPVRATEALVKVYEGAIRERLLDR